MDKEHAMGCGVVLLLLALFAFPFYIAFKTDSEVIRWSIIGLSILAVLAKGTAYNHLKMAGDSEDVLDTSGASRHAAGWDFWQNVRVICIVLVIGIAIFGVFYKSGPSDDDFVITTRGKVRLEAVTEFIRIEEGYLLRNENRKTIGLVRNKSEIQKVKDHIGD